MVLFLVQIRAVVIETLLRLTNYNLKSNNEIDSSGGGSSQMTPIFLCKWPVGWRLKTVMFSHSGHPQTMPDVDKIWKTQP